MTNKNSEKNISIQYRFKLIFIFLLIIISTLLTYRGIGTHDFINFDDELYVTKNQHVIQGITIDNIVWAFTPIKTDNKAYWHPLSWLYHMLDCQMFGLNAGMHHITSLILHIINALLLFIIFNKMTGALWKSAFVAALFALHPINVESVAWIAEKKNLLSTSFWMLTIIAYIYYAKRPGILKYLLLLLMFTMGLMAKTMLVTIPFVLLLLDYWPLKRVEFNKSVISRLVIEKIPLLLISAVAFGIVFLSLQSHGQIVSDIKTPMGLRLDNAAVSYIKYISKTLWPTGLAIHYPFPDALPAWQPISAGVILAVITGFVVLLAKNEPYLFLGWFWFTGTLVPVNGIIQGGLWPEMALRWIYVPAIGLFIMLAWGWDKISTSLPGRYIINTILAVIILSVLSFTSIKQLTCWKNSISIFEHTVQVTDKNPIAHLNLGEALQAKGKTKKAIDCYLKVLSISPNNTKAHINMGAALLEHKNYDKAFYHFKKALKNDPLSKQARLNLGNILFAQNKTKQAMNYYLELLKLYPDYTEAHNNLGNVLIKQRKFKKAVLEFSKVLKAQPMHLEAHINMGAALSYLNQNDKAIAHYSKALQIDPYNEEIYNNMGVVLIQKKEYNRAIKHFKKAIEINPDYTNAKNNLKRLMAIIQNNRRAD